jgi:6-phosphofructokinase
MLHSFAFPHNPDDCCQLLLQDAPNGIGIVRLMGRECGFVAVHATLAAGDVDVCLIPEVSFDMDKLFEYVETNLESKGHCLIVVAEGAGQEYFEGVDLGTDLSGNKKLPDVASYIKERAKSWFKGTPSVTHCTFSDRDSNQLPSSPFFGGLSPFCGMLKLFSRPWP